MKKKNLGEQLWNDPECRKAILHLLKQAPIVNRTDDYGLIVHRPDGPVVEVSVTTKRTRLWTEPMAA